MGCIAPVTIMWSPAGGATNSRLDQAVEEQNKMTEFRRAWLWVHPAAAKEALLEMKKACVLEGATWAGAVEVRLGNKRCSVSFRFLGRRVNFANTSYWS